MPRKGFGELVLDELEPAASTAVDRVWTACGPRVDGAGTRWERWVWWDDGTRPRVVHTLWIIAPRRLWTVRERAVQHLDTRGAPTASRAPVSAPVTAPRWS